VDLFDARGRAFRARLRAEIPLWRAENLVDERAAAALAARYRLNETGWKSSVAAIYLLGSLLVGGGIVSFVAWNWEALPAGAKLALLGTAMVAAHLAGYWLWRVRGNSPRLGHALVFLGTLVFGANVGLVAQIFHVHSDAMNGIGAWAIGAAVAGWALRSVPNALLAVSLGTYWSCAFVDIHKQVFPFTPLLLAAAFLPLARLERSRLLFAATCVAFAVTAAVHAGKETGEGIAVFATLFAWSAFLPFLHPSAVREESVGAFLAAPAARLGVGAWAILFYLASFGEIAEDMKAGALAHETLRWVWIAGPTLAGAAWMAASTRSRGAARWSDPWSPFLPFASTILLLGATTLPDPELAVLLVSNAALAAFAILLIATAVRSLERGPFWLGVGIAGVLVQSRFFEYETGLLLKAILFLACGIAVISVGVAFEKRVRGREAVGA
jgi:hypothetical protein